MVNEENELNEFKSSDGQSTSADPHATGSSARSADKSAGESSYSDTTKSEVLSAIMTHVASLDREQLGNVWKAMAPTKDNSRKADQSGGEGGPVRASPTAAKEDVEDIFGEDLTEEVKERAAVVFESAVNARLVSEMVRLEEEFETNLEESVESIRLEIVENVDKDLSYAVGEWLEENQVAIDNGLKTEMAEDFITGLKDLFEANYIDIPETEVDVVTEMASQIEALEARLNEEIEKNIVLEQTKEELKVDGIFESLTTDLAQTQVEKLRDLSENISYESAEDYERKINILKETYFPAKSTSASSESLNEEFDGEGDETVAPTGQMAAYVNATSRLIKK